MQSAAAWPMRSHAESLSHRADGPLSAQYFTVHSEPQATRRATELAVFPWGDTAPAATLTPSPATAHQVSWTLVSTRCLSVHLAQSKVPSADKNQKPVALLCVF